MKLGLIPNCERLEEIPATTNAWVLVQELNLSYHNTESLLASMHMFLKTQYALIYSYETLNPETQLER